MHHESVLRVQKHRQPRVFYRVPIIFFQSSHDDVFKQGNSKIALVEVCSDTDLNEHELYLYCNICSEANSADVKTLCCVGFLLAMGVLSNFKP